ncbi:hypothetical protein llg_34660 [Luteolibacter sp. LG18]|nr:hypothetical protein llg_34660 [Luteolibacter sp. LG18]
MLPGSLALATPPATPAHDLVFVTQVPCPVEVNSRTAVSSVTTSVSVFGNHLGDTYSAPRGGSLWLRRSASGANQFVDLLNTATWNIPGGKPNLATVAVRDPSVHWNGGIVLFSMVIGVPSSASDTTVFVWQLYEVTNLATGQTPVITKVANQPLAYNNICPCYGTNGRIIFASDRPHNGQANLYPQREEYLLRPTVTGLWSLDPASSDLFLLEHSPSGSFGPFIDSFGRVVFDRWDHLSRDPQAVTDRPPGTGDTYVQTTNGCGTYPTEASITFQAGVLDDFFPEPRNFDISGRAGTNLNGQSFNQFSPWVINENGTDEEFINHAGRHELGGTIGPSFNDDPNLVTNNPNVAPNVRTFADNMFWLSENPLSGGTYVAVNGPDVGYHGSGNIISFNGGLTAQGAPVNPESMHVSYLTPLPSGGTAHLYRNPIALTDGNLVAAHTTATINSGLVAQDANTGSAAAPTALYAYRLTTVTGSAPSMAPGTLLTNGFTANVTQYANGISVHYNGPLWELYPVELVSRTLPASHTNSVAAIESQVFTEEGVNLSLFQRDLTQKNEALIVSRNMTTRDDADKQQPFNLKVAWSNTQTIIPSANPGKIYTIGWLQILQADLRRSFTNGGAQPFPGRRVLATQLHDTVSENPPSEAGQPAGSVKVGNDGSMAAVVPARRALTWHLLDNDAAKTSVVKERYWVTFQPGEVRTCTSCHGLNDKDQAGNTAPQNKPEALRTLLQYWRNNHPFLTWRSQNFAPAAASDDTLSGPNADPDGDGIPNLAEYALGSNPSDSASRPGITGANTVDPNDGKKYLNLTFHRHLGMVDSTCHVETTTDLVHWNEGGGYTVVGSPVNDGNGLTETVVAKVAAPVDATDKTFIRLRVSQP